MKKIETKKCYVCGLEKSLDGFYKDKGRKDGYVGYCKECDKEYWKQRKEGKKGNQIVIGNYRVRSYDRNKVEIRK